MQAGHWPGLLCSSHAEPRAARQDPLILHNRSTGSHSVESLNKLVMIVGKPYFENIQYNTPIEMYDDGTVDEMVKIMNTPATAGLSPLAKPETLELVDAPKADK